MKKPKIPITPSEIFDDVFTDTVEMAKPRFLVDHDAYLHLLWEANKELLEKLLQ